MSKNKTEQHPNDWILDKDFKISFIDKDYLWHFRENLMDFITRIPIPLITFWNDYKKIVEFYLGKKYVGYAIADIEIPPENSLWEFYEKKVIPIIDTYYLTYIKNVYVDVKTFLEIIQNDQKKEEFIIKYPIKMLFFFKEDENILIQITKNNQIEYYISFLHNINYKDFLKNLRNWDNEFISKHLIIDCEALDFLNQKIENNEKGIFYHHFKNWILKQKDGEGA
jgi:hypothetical protein